MDDIPIKLSLSSPRFLDRFRLHIRAQNKSYATEKTYVLWVRRYILFHRKSHPKTLNESRIKAFLDCLAPLNPVYRRESHQVVSCCLIWR